MKHLTKIEASQGVDFLKSEILNGAVQNLATAPGTPVKGQIYFDTVSNRLFCWNGTGWIGADAVGSSMTAADILTAIKTVDGTGSGLDADTIDGIEASALVLTSRTVNSKALSGNISIDKTDVGLGSVTNDAQVKKAASSTNGSIPKWSGTSGDAIIDGYTVETSLTGASTALPRADAVKTYVDGLLSANDAMIYKGTLGSGGTITAIPTTYNVGWAYRVITAATYAGVVAEVGDLFVAIVDRTGTGNANADWTVIQTNADGIVTGPASAVSARLASFSGTSGKVLADSGYSAADFVAAAHTTGHLAKYTVACGTSTTWTVTHNLNTQNLTYTIKDASTHAVVQADVVMTSANVLTVTLAVAPTNGQYSITVIG